jgi:hypothetical protein
MDTNENSLEQEPNTYQRVPNMVEVKLVVKGIKGNVIIKGNSFAEVLKEYERNKKEIDKTLGATVVIQPVAKAAKGITADTLQGRISSLAQDGFFVTSKTANEVREALKERGYSYPIDHISIGLIRLVRKKSLRRLTEKREGKEVYVYVNP